MENSQFDKIVKATLQKLEVPYDADQWKRMEQTLDADKTTQGVEGEDSFDAFISGKLEGLSITSAAMPDWNRMEEALDKAEMPNTVFDKEVKARIYDIKPTYQPSHWELLAERLRRQKAIKESLFKNKISEFTLFILLLINFYNYFPDYQAVPYQTADSAEIASLPIAEEIPVINQVVEISEPKNSETIPLSIAVKEPLSTTTSLPPTTIDQSSNTTLFISDNSLFISPVLEVVDINGVSSQPSREQTDFGIDGKKGLTIRVPEMTKHLDYLGLTNASFVETLPSLKAASLATASIVPLECTTCNRYKIPARFRFGIVAHVGGTSAVRTGKPFLSNSALTQKGSGYGGGFTLGFKYSRAEIETGLIYAGKSYAVNIDEFYKNGNGVNRKQFKGINLQTLQIPINLRYNFNVSDKGKWHLYAQAGINMNVILRAQYDFVDRQANSRSITASIQDRSSFNESSYNQGIFGGDTFKENRFFTLNLGVGAEYYLSPKFSIFMQPDFHYYTSQARIGPNRDQINSVSVSFGVRTSFH